MKLLLNRYITILQLTCFAYSEVEIIHKKYFSGSPLADYGEGWSSNVPIKATNCGSYNIIGGFGVFSSSYLQIQLTNLHEHVKIKLQALFLKIDSWDNENITLYADGIQVWQRAFQPSDGTEICGGSGGNYAEMPVNVDITFPHTDSSLFLKFQDSLNDGAGNESWGIRDIIISYVVPRPDICGSPCQVIYF